MASTEAVEQYRLALKSGQKYYNDCIARGVYPYPQVLEEICNESMSAAKVDLGVMDIPIDAIVGTLASGRKAAFAGNFMPILPLESEFGAKWTSLCDHHLSESGITDAIVCLEYLGRFYVQEGHKRVSVLKSFGAVTISAHVQRIIPAWSDDPAVKAYYEFLAFYKLAGIYQMMFRRPGCYEKLQADLGFEKDHVWTKEERADFLSLFWKVRELCTPQLLEQVRFHSRSEVLLACLEVYPYQELQTLSQAELKKRINAILPDLRFAAEDEPAAVSTEPEALPGKGIVGRILDGISRPTLRIAMVHVADPETSPWSRGHEIGARRLEKTFGDQVTVRSYVTGSADADQVMARAVEEDGAQLLIATAPTLLAAARKTAALHPQLKVLVCALSVPYVGIRTYYARIYEAKFVSGAIAGAMAGEEPIGYIARYPIMGVPAAVNAFALGARMTNPSAHIQLEWSCLPGDPVEKLKAAGVKIISGHPVAAHDHTDGVIGWSTARIEADGSFHPLACDVWNWGKLYTQIAREILGGAWKTLDAAGGSAINYWWGVSSGVMNVRLAQDLPTGVAQLATILRSGLANASVQPFACPIADQNGVVRSDGEHYFTPDEIMHMNWLADNVQGYLPTVDELLPMSRETTRLLAIPPDAPQRESSMAVAEAPELGD